MRYQYMLMTVTMLLRAGSRDVPAVFYIILPISIILGAAFNFIINSSRKKSKLPDDIELSQWKENCPVKYGKILYVSEDYTLFPSKDTFCKTADILRIRKRTDSGRKGGIGYTVEFILTENRYIKIGLSSEKSRDQLYDELDAFLTGISGSYRGR